MNFIDMIFIIIFLVIVFDGYSKGFAVSLLSLIRTLVVFPIAFIVSGFVSQPLYDTFFKQMLTDSVQQQVAAGGIDNSVNELVSSLPSFISGIADTSFLNNAEAELTRGVMENVITPVAVSAIKMILFVLTVIVLYVVIWAVIRFVKKKSDKRDMPFHKTNKLLGAVFGIVKAVAFVVVFTSIMNFMLNIADFSTENAFVNEIATSSVYNFAVNCNPLLK